MQIVRRWRAIGAVSAGLLLLAGCDYGDTRGADRVGDTTARLEGYVHTDSAETVTWWFEYGPTPGLGSTTPERSFTTTQAEGGGGSVYATVTGLAEGTTHHYRHCVRNGNGAVVCGAPKTVTTTAGRDSVVGLGIASEIPELGYHLGASVDASSAPDGSSPEGQASRSPGTHFFRIPDSGEVTCLRVEGNRAAVGFVADWTMYDPSLPLVPLVLHIEDNGTAGDRFAVAAVVDPPTTCPDPDVLLDASPGNTVLIGDGFVVHDHP